MNPIAQILANLKDGTIVKGRTLKAALKALQRAFPIQGENIRLREYPDGTVIAALPGGTADTCPLQGLANGDRFELITGGLIGGLIAENLFGAAGELPSYTPLATGFNWIVAYCTSSNGRMTNVEIDLTTTQPPVITPTEGAPPTSFTIPLYAIYYDGTTSTAYRLWGCGNLNLRPRRIYFRVDATAGCAYPLIHTWTWEVTG